MRPVSQLIGSKQKQILNLPALSSEPDGMKDWMRERAKESVFKWMIEWMKERVNELMNEWNRQ
jgi:hypothetical protein